MTLEQAAVSRRDNYLPLRHLAALMVIYGHCYALASHPEAEMDVVARWMPGFYAGSLAIYVFFAMSGYLVTLSLLKHPGIWRYARNRLLRVYPGYLACLFVCTFVIGVLFTTLTSRDYLQAPQTWQYFSYNLKVVSLVWTLPGVFTGNHYPDVVNGALWSLGLEVRWYLYLGLLAALTVVRRRTVFTIAVLAWLGYGGWQWWTGQPDPLEHRALSQVFLLATLCAQWRERIPVSHAIMIGLIALALLSHGSGWFGPSVAVTTVYATFWIAYRLPPLPWRNDIDLSYGLFLYGFPVQQSLAHLFPSMTPLQMLPCAASVTLVLAIVSWYLVERPALALKQHSRLELHRVPA